MENQNAMVTERCRRCCATLTPEERHHYVSLCEVCAADIRRQAREANTPVKSPVYVLRYAAFILRRYRHIRKVRN